MEAFRKETAEETAFRKQSDICESVLGSALGAALPSGTDFHFYKTFPEFRENMDHFRQRVVKLLLKFPGAEDGDAEALKDPEDALNWLIDMMDRTLEQVDKDCDSANDELGEAEKINFRSNQGKNAAPMNAGQVAGQKASNQKRSRQQEWILAQAATADSVRPQKEFQDKIDNSNSVFRGVLDHWREFVKHPNAVPARLAPHVHKIRPEAAPEEPPHPLVDMVEDLVYPPQQLAPTQPTQYRGLDHAPLHYVDTVEKLEEMAAKLATAQELAVDLEHHSFRTFLGLTCLMQVSDRESDFLVDVLKLRNHIGPVLAPLFADPQVVKVLHGADWDVLWLQRDFGIYIVNLFDTGQASRVLKHDRHGLVHLLEHYCQVTTDKRYQLADWRVRPLSPELQLYARMDTHYLLYMYDCLRMELLEADEDIVPPHLLVDIPSGKPGGPLGIALERSRQICLRRYNKPLFTEEGYIDVLSSFREPVSLKTAQELVFAALFRWRDRVARERDESFDYILAKRQMLSIAKALPSSLKEFKAALANDNTPSLALSLGEDILGVVEQTLTEAKARGIDGRSSKGEQAPGSPAAKISTPSVFWQGPKLHTGLRPQWPDAHASAAAGETIQATGVMTAAPSAGPKLPPPAVEKLGGTAFSATSKPASSATSSVMQSGAAELREDKRAGFVAEPMSSPSTVERPCEDSNARNGNGRADLLAGAVTSDHQVAGSTGSGAQKSEAAASKATSTMRAMFGGKSVGSVMARAIAKKRPSAFGCLFSSSTQNKAAIETAQKLRDQFNVPFPTISAEAVQAKEKEEQERRAAREAARQGQAVPGAEVRAVVDTLIAENAAVSSAEESSVARDAPPGVLLGDFLPLLGSEDPPRSKRLVIPSRREGEDGAEGQSGEESSSDDEVESRSNSGDDAVDKVMRQTGLESSSDSESDAVCDAFDTSGKRHPGPTFPKAVKKQRVEGQPRGSGQAKEGPLRGFEGGRELQETKRAGRGSESGNRQAGPGAAMPTGGTTGFDYAAARAAAPGLDVVSSPASQGRGQGRGGRGSRGRGRSGSGRTPPTAPADAFNPYQIDEAKMMKGGKRSSVMPRSGNRSSTFG